MGDSLYGTLRVRVERGGKTNIRTFRTKVSLVEELHDIQAKRILSKKMVSFLRTKRRSYTNIRPIRGGTSDS